MLDILLWTVVAVVSTGVIWKGSGLLESSSERLSAYYRLPDIVQYPLWQTGPFRHR